MNSYFESKKRFAFSSLVFLCILVLSGGLSHSQTVNPVKGSGNAGDPSSIQVKISSAEAMSNATDSFDKSAESLIEELLGEKHSKDSEKGKTLQDVADEYSDEYTKLVSEKINELKGDGTLTASEVTRELGNLRDQQLATLEEILRARIDGFSAPPQKRDFSSVYTYSVALLSYAFFDRNTVKNWIIFLIIVASIDL